jgi:spore germination protein KC
MRNVKLILLSGIILINSFATTACWNYREVEDLAIVAGAAVDKGEKARYKLTVEVVKIAAGNDAVTESKLISSEGDTIFDCARNAISVSGKRLYWSHNKILIISKAVAEKGVIEMIDWFNRDSETRANVQLAISAENTAEDIFKGKEVIQTIKAFEMEEMLKNEKNLSKSPRMEVWEFANNMAEEGIYGCAAVAKLKEMDGGGKTPTIGGTAIFKGDKLIGIVDEDKTMDILFTQDNIKGGLLVETVKDKDKDKEIPITFEIFKSKTKIKPVFNKNQVKINVDIETTVALAELGGCKDLIEEKGREELIKLSETALKNRVEKTIKGIQKEYGTDIFGFGKRIYENEYKEWQKIKDNWDENFKNLQVNVKTKIIIKNSSMLSKPLEVRKN